MNQVKTDAFAIMATEMCNVHNIIIRGMNSIYVQSEHVQSSDRKAFIGYCLSWHRFISHHHNSEEIGFFKPLQEMIGPDVMAESAEEHRAFHDGLDRYHAYLVSLAGREQDFDGKALVEIVDAFTGALMKHLNNEISAILNLKKLDKEKLVIKAWADAVQNGVGTLRGSDFVTMFPFGFVAHDMTYENGMHKDFPQVPWLMKILVRYVASYWNGSWWKFAPCDRSGIPKKLYAAADN